MRSGVGVYNTPLNQQPSTSQTSLIVQNSGSTPSISPFPNSQSQHSQFNNPNLETTIVSSGQKETLKTQFVTREGVYKQMTVSECKSRVNVTQGSNTPASVSNAPVRVSFMKVNKNEEDDNENKPSSSMDRLCFNIGRDLYVYDFENITGALDWSKPVDKRVYKGTYPTCHDFNQTQATQKFCVLLVGFSAGQIQLIDPIQKEYPSSRLFNEERYVEKSAVTCLKWIPNQSNQFVVTHQSGYMYVYNEDLPCANAPVSYVVAKQTENFTVSTVKSRQNRNPVKRIQIGKGAINQFEFAPNSPNLMAVVGQDGFLRVFRFAQMELVCQMRSYFGGLLCLAWSPDQKLIATGGEDDLLTVFSVVENRVLCRGQGHKSWISSVAFDPYVNLNIDNKNGIFKVPEELDGYIGSSVEDTVGVFGEVYGNKEENGEPVSIKKRHMPTSPSIHINDTSQNVNEMNDSNFPQNQQFQEPIFYRIGTVSHDTHLCLWDVGAECFTNFKEQPSSSVMTTSITTNHTTSTHLSDRTDAGSPNDQPETSGIKEVVKEPKPKQKFFLHKRVLSFGSRNQNGDRTNRSRRNSSTIASQTNGQPSTDPTPLDPTLQLFGGPQCPRMDNVQIIEPLICKKIAHERLTVLCFRPECLVTACQEGYVCTWARPTPFKPIQ